MPDDTTNRESLLETARELENDLSGTDDPQEQASLRQAIEFLHWIASALDHEKDHHMPKTPIIPIHRALTVNLHSYTRKPGCVYRHTIEYSLYEPPVVREVFHAHMDFPNQPEAVYLAIKDLRDAARNLNGTERNSYPKLMHEWLIASQYELETLCALLGG